MRVFVREDNELRRWRQLAHDGDGRSTRQERRRGMRRTQLGCRWQRWLHEGGRSACRDRPWRAEPLGGTPPRSAQYLISGFRNSVTAMPPWSRSARLAWPEFDVLVAKRFEEDCRVCSGTLTRSGSRKLR